MGHGRERREGQDRKGIEGKERTEWKGREEGNGGKARMVCRLAFRGNSYEVRLAFRGNSYEVHTSYSHRGR